MCSRKALQLAFASVNELNACFIFEYFESVFSLDELLASTLIGCPSFSKQDLSLCEAYTNTARN